MFISYLCFMLFLSSATCMDMNELLKELSWPLKLKILNEVVKPTDKPITKTTKTYMPGIIINTHDYIINDEKPDSPTTEAGKAATQDNTETAPTTETNQIENQRQVDVQLLRAAEQVHRRANPSEEADDKDMRLKLFRLMYETVRDSDLKVKRAELIKDHYANSTAFEVGYLVGDITDKANIINDISLTLERFRDEWKPMEHINAYEQIANQAIEITHLIDLVRLVSKRENL